MTKSDKVVMQQALDVLMYSLDSVYLAHADAVNLYSGYPLLERKITALKNDVDVHEAAVAALQQAIAQPEHRISPPLTADQLFANEHLMTLNATNDMTMSEIIKFVRVIEAAIAQAVAPPVIDAALAQEAMWQKPYDICMSRALSLSRDGKHAEANEASKCASAIKYAKIYTE